MDPEGAIEGDENPLIVATDDPDDLQAAPPPPHIDPVHPAEIHLVVWMAIAPPTR